MASANPTPRETLRSLKSLREQRNITKSTTDSKTLSTQSRIDLITRELDSLRRTVEPATKKHPRALQTPKKHRMHQALNSSLLSQSSLLEKAVAASVALEPTSTRLSLHLCETLDFSQTNLHNSLLNETSGSVQSSARTKRTLLRTPSVLKSTSKSSTPTTSIEPVVQVMVKANSFIFKKPPLLKKKRLVDQASELLTSLKDKPLIRPSNSIISETKLVEKGISTKGPLAPYPALLRTLRTTETERKFRKIRKR